MTSEIKDVTATARANVYFDGKVVSHSLRLADGSKKTLGLIYPGEYAFDTDAPEHMEMTSGRCRVQLDGQASWTDCLEGSSFEVPGKSRFKIAVDSGIAQYICSFR